MECAIKEQKMKNFTLSKLTNPLLATVGSKINEIFLNIEFTNEERQELAVFYKPFSEILEQFLSARRHTDLSNTYIKKEKLNRIRIQNLTSLKMSAKSYLNSTVEIERNTARDLSTIIKNNQKDLKARTYDLLSLMINGITTEIDDKISAENLSLIGATKWLDELKISQSEFNKHATDQSVALSENTMTLTPCDLRKDYLIKLKTFINSIPFQAIKTPSENYQKLILGINEILAKTTDNKTVKSKSNAKQESSNSENIESE